MINYSIIIPHYNTPDLLGRCIKSIPLRDDVQIIVVDDDSPGNENYLTSIPELTRSGVEYYVTKAGKGAGHARNVGLEHAEGKWLVFADSDDFFVDNFSEILDSYIDNPSDIVFFNIMSCDCYDTSKIIPSKKDRLFANYYKSNNELFFRVGSTEPWGKFIKRSLIVDNNISFQETRGHNDLLFSVMSGLKANGICVVNEPIYWYVVREGSLGHQKGFEPIVKIQDRMVAWKSTQDYLTSMNVKTKMYLPAIPFIRAFIKKPAKFFTLVKVTGKAGCSRFLIIYEVLRYFLFRRFVAERGLAIDLQIAE